jgi:hypothetical protein
MTAPTTPTGSRTIIASASRPVGVMSSLSLSMASACQRIVLAVSGMSMARVSAIGLPASRLSICASSSVCASIASATANRTRLRSAGAIVDHGPCSTASRAARTARSTSAASPSATSVSGCPVAGLWVVNRAPLAASANAPSMNRRVRKSRSGWAMAMGAASESCRVTVETASAKPDGGRESRTRQSVLAP